ncbi:porin [Pleionea litopenaei]|uniref:Porin n=1 Tax=Pleionea litopenaei TaxID=3070815 RepID=A0AA51RQM3_9GAMM|nr:porin [Pleionea sp. HL-JVS1]WMS85842.1 porin [Pleionea sp. HL-JVS1]
MFRTLLPLLAGISTVAFAQDSQPTKEELQKAIEQQAKQIEELQQQMNAAVEAIEDKSSAQSSDTNIGGYGELHYNNFDTKEDIDFHRFVLFVSHKYSDKLRFFSELEVEHAYAGEGKPGAVELEQAYIEYDLSSSTTLKGGLFLVPVGLLNETHEPDTFYGVERNPIEKNIIPTTWWEAGAGVSYRFAEGLTFDFAAHSGLNVDPADFDLRSGRQKVAKADGDSFAYTARLKYTGIPGLEIAGSFQHQDDITQGAANAEAQLLEMHAVYATGPFAVRALWAQWDINNSIADTLGKDVQTGYFLEPAYRITEEFGVFARYSVWDNTAGSANTLDTEMRQVNVGVNYWIHPNVVVKFDFENRLGAQDGSGVNAGLGYQF